jgi:hypothetical protein
MAIIISTMPKRQKPTRREHIVPRLLLANFTDSNGVLWVYTKDRAARERRDTALYCSLAYSARACFRTGMSGSASFHEAKKS